MTQEHGEFIAAWLDGQTEEEFIQDWLKTVEDCHSLDQLGKGVPITPEGRPTPPLPKAEVVATIRSWAGRLGFSLERLTPGFLNRFNLNRNDFE
jgi:hypothetical protein